MEISRRRKILLIVLGALVLGLLFYLLRPRAVPTGIAPSPRRGFLPRALDLFRGTPTPEPTPLPPEVLAQLRSQERIFRISHGPALGGALSPDGKSVRYFLRQDGSLWESDLEGLKRQQLGTVTFPNLIAVSWSPKRDSFIVTTSDDDNRLTKQFYSVSAGFARALNSGVEELAFSPDGSAIIYNFLNRALNESTVALSNPDGSNFRTLRQVNFRDFTLFWPKREIAIVATKPSGIAETFVYRLDTRTGTLTKLLGQAFFGVGLRWSPDGNRVLLSQSDGSGVLQNNLSGGLYQPFPQAIPGLATFAEKCAFFKDSVTVICGVPRTSPEGALLPDDYYKGIFVPSDEVVTFNLAASVRSVVAPVQELFPPQDVFEPFLADDERMLFFLNRQDDYLYALRLAPAGR